LAAAQQTGCIINLGRASGELYAERSAGQS
jgi:hypothetical protein